MTDQRRVLSVSGPDRMVFLQSLVTNDVERVKHGPIYAALLTPQGKYLADFFISAGDEALMIDVKAELAQSLVSRLLAYRLRSKVEIGNADFFVARGYDHPPPNAVRDPRHPAMGWRALVSSRAEVECLPEPDAVRIRNCIPESLIELVPNKTYILEAGFERLNGVDFSKGCYVGQEVTARMKHKSNRAKGLVTVGIKGQAPVGTEILADGRPVGRLFSQAGGLAIAYLRLDRARGRRLLADSAELTLSA